ncbi:hypothetical protein CR513_11325, partial [Mucuna pruriens]
MWMYRDVEHLLSWHHAKLKSGSLLGHCFETKFVSLGYRVSILRVFKSFKAEVELQLGKKIKAIKFDRGSDYYGRYDGSRKQHLGPFVLFLRECRIVMQYTMSSKPSINDVAE